MPACSATGSAVSRYMTPKIGANRSLLAGVFLMALGTAIVGAGGMFLTQRRALYWIGYSILGGLGNGLTLPSTGAILCEQVPSTHVGKVFSCSGFANNLGIAVAVFVFSNLLFHSSPG